MKKLILSLILLGITQTASQATGIDYSQFYDKGVIFSGSTFPQSTSNDVNNADSKNLQNLKVGVASKRNVLGLFEIGNAGIMQAAKNGNINKIHYVDTTIGKAYIPLFFIPIYAKCVTTTVYGE